MAVLIKDMYFVLEWLAVGLFIFSAPSDFDYYFDTGGFEISLNLVVFIVEKYTRISDTCLGEMVLSAVLYRKVWVGWIVKEQVSIWPCCFVYYSLDRAFVDQNTFFYCRCLHLFSVSFFLNDTINRSVHIVLQCWEIEAKTPGYR